MTTPSRTAVCMPSWGLAIAAMLSIQLGAALSVDLIETIGAAGTAWIRLTIGGGVFLLLARPRRFSITRSDLPGLIGLGVSMGLVTITFLAAIERIPLGTAVAVQFLGPLTLAAIRSHNLEALVWPLLALVGVTLLTHPWQGHLDFVGLAFAAVAAVGWAAYIVLTQSVGDRFAGITGLAIAVPIAAITAATVGIPQAHGHITPGVLAASAGLAILLPILPSALEMFALREMTTSAFGTLMSIEPAIGALIGLLVLRQHPGAIQLVGVVLVVLAGAAAQRDGQRQRSEL